jgi:enoyl-CoA hydratase
MSSSYETVSYDIQGGVARVTMQRPEQRNALNTSLIRDLDDALHRADADEQVNAIVLAGAGPSFCAGHDLKEVMGDPEVMRARSQMQSRMDLERHLYLDKSLSIRDLDTPTIAMVQGHCVAAGVILCAMCDFIVAAEDAVFRDPTLDMGGGGAAAVEVLWHPWELGIRPAKRFLFFGEELTAADALEAGFVSWVFPRPELERRTLDLAQLLAAKPPGPIRLVKRSIRQMLNGMGQRDAFEYHFLVHQLSHDGERHDEASPSSTLLRDGT